MHAVVNRLTLARPIDDELARRAQQELGDLMLASPGFQAFYFVRVSDEEAIIIVLFDDEESLVRGSKQVASPWFKENIQPYLSGTQRVTGEVVATRSRA